MSDLTIARLTATVHATDEFDLVPRVDRMLRNIADRGLEAGLARADLPGGEWCVRRLDIAVTVGPGDVDATVESNWADAVLGSLRGALSERAADVLYYRGRHDALADLVAEITAGRAGRAWAWRQLGLLPPAGALPAGDSSPAILAALRKEPQHALHAVLAAVRLAGVAALDRALGRTAWSEVARVVAGAVGAPDVMTRAPTATAGREVPAGASLPTGTVLLRDHIARVRQAMQSSTLAQAVRRGGLRAPAEIGRAWAVIAFAEADPVALRLDVGPLLATAGAELLASPAPRREPGLRRSVDAVSPGEPLSRPTSDREDMPAAAAVTGKDLVASGDDGRATQPPGSPTNRREGDAEKAATSSSGEGAATVWGGLLFLLATAGAAGVPDDLLDDERLRSRSIRWVMHNLARALVPVAGSDPAALAFAGLPPDAEAPAGPPASDREQQALVSWADRWAAATVARLDPVADTPHSEIVADICRRRGRVQCEGGWIEVCLRLEDIDIAVRRAGLDVDPGWVPWLGLVVRFVYE